MKLKENYQQAVKVFQPKPPYVLNGIKAFFIGGLLCLAGEALQKGYVFLFDMSLLEAQHLMLLTFIFLAIVLTGIGTYDSFSQFAGAGATILITGFANALASAALEHRSEGWITGVANHMFKIGGAVIVYGIVVAYLFGTIHLIF
ncbi:SpoVA/SpoVAEb family sporulation membrane protein [Thermaerobacillus caldiproteolyticus]|uniref:Stage V sporulation protein AC n=1 Tax=Thermaerobacillus caldiproteolyticus TaxID=247480 RepID=A0A7V9Z3D3_9BACL|nr:SpoVA/SpoVAEb family sporulation membrane protein [Anoxybacillus caldiproteolyticus]MBA2873317.1 stage V sporulation protein AC [Anoxybacillus caldiproteolyticus]